MTLFEPFHSEGPSIKDVCTQEGGGFVQCEHFVDKGGGVLQMRTSALLDAKNFVFFEIYDAFPRTRGERVQPVRILCGQGGRGQFFAILCGLLHGRPLTGKLNFRTNDVIS